MSDSIQKLREAIRREAVMATKHGRCICATCDEATEDAHAALAAVEQELAALRLSYENASRAHFEATKRIDALTECQAKLKAELDEEVDHNARLSAKLDETKHNCACDYDERGAVCLVHTRPVREARERIAALEAERDELRKKIADGRYVVCVMCGERIGGYDPADMATVRAVRLAAVAHEYACPKNPLAAELAELRKRPTLEEVLAEMDKVPDKPAGLNFGVAACAMKVTGLYARKTGA